MAENDSTTPTTPTTGTADTAKDSASSTTTSKPKTVKVKGLVTSPMVRRGDRVTVADDARLKSYEKRGLVERTG